MFLPIFHSDNLLSLMLNCHSHLIASHVVTVASDTSAHLVPSPWFHGLSVELLSYSFGNDWNCTCRSINLSVRPDQIMANCHIESSQQISIIWCQENCRLLHIWCVFKFFRLPSAFGLAFPSHCCMLPDVSFLNKHAIFWSGRCDWPRSGRNGRKDDGNKKKSAARTRSSDNHHGKERNISLRTWDGAPSLKVERRQLQIDVIAMFCPAINVG